MILLVLLLSVSTHLATVEGVGYELFLHGRGPKISSRSLPGGPPFCYEQTATGPKNCDEASRSSPWQKDDCLKTTRQSPINIVGDKAKPFKYTSCCPIDFASTGLDKYDLEGFTVTDNGYTIQVTPPKGHRATFRWPDKNLGEYTLAQVHFHWGKDENEGSEHHLNREKFSLEMHLVHYRSKGFGKIDKFPNIDKASGSDHGQAIAVIAVMFTEGGPLELLDPLTKTDGGIDKAVASSSHTADSVSPKLELSKVFCQQSLIHPDAKGQIMAYHYEGSLTTPPCKEIVQWIVLPEAIPIRTEDLAKFRTLYGGTHTFRKLQSTKPAISKVELVLGQSSSCTS